eukprot:5695993-Karenia_brevis.AAC.1
MRAAEKLRGREENKVAYEVVDADARTHIISTDKYSSRWCERFEEIYSNPNVVRTDACIGAAQHFRCPDRVRANV